jgi:hypothetical protein
MLVHIHHKCGDEGMSYNREGNRCDGQHVLCETVIQQLVQTYFHG